MKQIWMNTAKDLARRSTCKRLQVGCVITSLDLSQVYSVGYNGNYRGGPNVCDSKIPGSCGDIHSESNALIKVRVNDLKKVMFVTTFPCKACSKLIVNSGFSKIYYHNKYRLDESKSILKKSHIDYEQI